MGISKSDEFSLRDNHIAQYAKALSHPARVAIVRMLLDRVTCVCGDIVDELPLSQSTVSQHLKELKQAGIIKGEISGPNICYCIDETNWSVMQAVLKNFIELPPKQKNNCC